MNEFKVLCSPGADAFFSVDTLQSYNNRGDEQQQQMAYVKEVVTDNPFLCSPSASLSTTSVMSIPMSLGCVAPQTEVLSSSFEFQNGVSQFTVPLSVNASIGVKTVSQVPSTAPVHSTLTSTSVSAPLACPWDGSSDRCSVSHGMFNCAEWDMSGDVSFLSIPGATSHYPTLEASSSAGSSETAAMMAAAAWACASDGTNVLPSLPPTSLFQALDVGNGVLAMSSDSNVSTADAARANSKLSNNFILANHCSDIASSPRISFASSAITHGGAGISTERWLSSGEGLGFDASGFHHDCFYPGLDLGDFYPEAVMLEASLFPATSNPTINLSATVPPSSSACSVLDNTPCVTSSSSLPIPSSRQSTSPSHFATSPEVNGMKPEKKRGTARPRTRSRSACRSVHGGPAPKTHQAPPVADITGAYRCSKPTPSSRSLNNGLISSPSPPTFRPRVHSETSVTNLAAAAGRAAASMRASCDLAAISSQAMSTGDSAFIAPMSCSVLSTSRSCPDFAEIVANLTEPLVKVKVKLEEDNDDNAAIGVIHAKSDTKATTDVGTKLSDSKHSPFLDRHKREKEELSQKSKTVERQRALLHIHFARLFSGRSIDDKVIAKLETIRDILMPEICKDRLKELFAEREHHRADKLHQPEREGHASVGSGPVIVAAGSASCKLHAKSDKDKYQGFARRIRTRCQEMRAELMSALFCWLTMRLDPSNRIHEQMCEQSHLCSFIGADICLEDISQIWVNNIKEARLNKRVMHRMAQEDYAPLIRSLLKSIEDNNSRHDVQLELKQMQECVLRMIGYGGVYGEMTTKVESLGHSEPGKIAQDGNSTAGGDAKEDGHCSTRADLLRQVFSGFNQGALAGTSGLHFTFAAGAGNQPTSGVESEKGASFGRGLQGCGENHEKAASICEGAGFEMDSSTSHQINQDMLAFSQSLPMPSARLQQVQQLQPGLGNASASILGDALGGTQGPCPPLHNPASQVNPCFSRGRHLPTHSYCWG